MKKNITEMEIFLLLPWPLTSPICVSSLSCLIPSPNSNLNGISDEYQNQIQVPQDKHGLDCILNKGWYNQETEKSMFEYSNY